MKSSIPITLIIVGALLVAAPFTYSFIIAALNEHGVLDSSSRNACTFLGTALIVVGVVFSFMSRPSSGGSSK